LATQASNLKQSGIVAGIDVLRAQVRLGSENTRLTNAENSAQKAKLELARMIGLPLGQEFTLVDEFPDVPVTDVTIDQALQRAYQERPDYLGAVARVRAAEASRQAIAGQSLPVARVTADYGALGLSPTSTIGTYALAGSVTVPVFQGGRNQGRLIEADADIRTRRAEVEKLRADIYYELRDAFLDMQATAQALASATESRALAAQALTQSRDRFEAGVTNNLEVVQAQEALAVADEQLIDARYGSLVARAMLAGSLGIAESEIKRYLGGGNR
jgi:outer membrane protein TolC